ncbi:MAG: ABC transporter ATP-binding protein, partial [Pseudomonadota bacterium]
SWRHHFFRIDGLMAENSLVKQRTLPELFRYIGIILGPERPFYTLAIIYGLGIGLLSLATPISVQMLINSIVNTGLAAPLVVLSLTLLALLLIAVALNALRLHLVDVFGRRFYARMVSEIALRAMYALNPFFDDNSAGPLFNRYFDIIIVMKRIPYLLVGGFSILLQAAVGFVLTSLYHPLFLGFNLVMIVLIWLIWLIWGNRAIKSAMDLSHKKHATAAWIEGLAASNGFFKTQRHIDKALRETDAATADYMSAHKRHFSHYFSQAVAFLLLYAFASASLLGLGGWLVIQGELSIGQLVAAELVLSAVFLGLSQLGTYLSYFFDLCAAVDELSLFDEIEQEDAEGGDEHLPGSALTLVEARGETRGIAARFDFELPAASMTFARAPSYAVQRLFTNFMKRHGSPTSGYITVGGVDTHSIKAHALRHEVMVLDRPNTTEMSIRDFLTLSAENVSSASIVDALEIVGLTAVIGKLPNGIDHRVASTGWPLSVAEMMQLKLAAAIIAEPRVLILNQIYDMLPYEQLMRVLRKLRQCEDMSIIYFSNRDVPHDFSNYLYMGRSQQRVFGDRVTFTEHYAERVEARRLSEQGGSEAANA